MAGRVRALAAEHRVLAALLVAGLALRAYLFVIWRPAFTGFPDSGQYLHAAEGTWFNEPLRAVGYPVLLWLLRVVSDSLAWIATVQHLLGLATTVLAYAALRQLGAPRWAALVPAVVLALHGTLISLEHAPLNESFFVSLVLAGLALCVRAGLAEPGRRALATAALAGLVLGIAGTVRTNGLVLVFVGAAYLLWAGPPRGLGRRLAAPVACLATGLVLLATNLVLVHDATGEWAFAHRDAYQSYGRVASFADCTKFEPPAGTEALCPTTPVAERRGAGYWLYDAGSPLLQRFGGAHGGSATPEDLDDIDAFTRAAILGQTRDYLRTVARDIVRLVDPYYPLNPAAPDPNANAGYLPDQLLDQLVAPGFDGAALQHHRGVAVHHGDITVWRSYYRTTSLVGIPIVLLLVAAWLAPFLHAGERRKAAALYLAASVALLVLPILGLSWNWRYEVVALPALASAAALGAWAIADRRRG